MFRVLLATRLQALFSSFFRSSKIKKQRGPIFRVLITAFVIYILAALMFTSGSMFYAVGGAFISYGMDWLYFALMGIMAFALGFIGSIFMTQTQIFEAKDNDFLLSMPIKPSYILASRMAMLIILNYIYQALVMLPAYVLYVYWQGFNIVTLLFFLSIFILLPFLTMTLSSIIGWVVAIISSKMRRKNIITTIMMLLFFFAYLMFFSRIEGYITTLIENGAAIGEAIQKAVPPMYHLGASIVNSDLLSLAIFFALCIVPFALIYFVLSKTFLKIATAKKGNVRVEYKHKPMKAVTARTALLKKEYLRFISLPMYIFNAGLGLIMMVLFAVLIAIRGEEIIASFIAMPEISDFFVPVTIAVLCLSASMTIITAPSISLEGKYLWIAKSLPVNPIDILYAKLATHIFVSIPFIIVAGAICAIALDSTIITTIMLFLLPFIICVFSAFFGIVINLHFPRFDWMNETVAIKQSASTLIVTFGNMAMVALPLIIYISTKMYLTTNIEMFLIICFLFYFILSAALWLYLKSRGQRMFEEL